MLLASFVLLIALYPGCCPGLLASAPSGARCLRLLHKKKSVHILGFSVTKGSPFYAICDVFVNTCEGRVHALNPPSVYRASRADVKGEPSFLALYAYAKRNKIKKENSSMGNAIKTYKRIYIYIIIDVHGVTQWSRPIGYSDQPMTNRDFPVSH